MEDNLIKIAEASKISGIPDSTLYDWIKEGRIRVIDDGKNKLLDKIEVLKATATVITFYNLKGGVLKTSLSRTLGFYFATQAKDEVLFIDLDPQGNLTKSLTAQRDFLTIHNFLENNTSLDKIVINVMPKMDLIPANLNLAKDNDFHIDYVNEKMLNEFKKLFKKYKIVIIDCPPNFTGLTRLGAVIANYIFIPVQPDVFSYEGIGLALELMNNIVKFNSNFIDYRAVLTMVRNNMVSIEKHFKAKLEDDLKKKLLHNYIPDFYAMKEVNATLEDIYQDKYKGDKLDKVRDVCKEIENIIYYERG